MFGTYLDALKRKAIWVWAAKMFKAQRERENHRPNTAKLTAMNLNLRKLQTFFSEKLAEIPAMGQI